MALRVRLAQMMVKIVPKIYRQHMIYERGRPVLYVTPNKALYGCLRFSLMFYKWIVADMRVKGFEPVLGLHCLKVLGRVINNRC